MNRLLDESLVILAFLFLLGIFISNALIQLVTILLFLSGIILTVKKYQINQITTIERLIIALFFSSGLSIYLSSNPELSAKNIVYHSILLTAIPLGYVVKSSNKVSIQHVYKFISTFALLTASMGILRYFNGTERAYGFFGGYYTLACVLAFSIPISIAFIFYSKDFWKYFTFASTCLQITALWLTYTRSALLGLVIAGICITALMFFNSQITKSLKLKILSLSFAGSIILVILLLNSSDTRLNPMLFFSNPDLSSGRNEIYSDAYAVFSSDVNTNWRNIFFGHGLESRRILFPQSPYTSWESEYIETFISQGLLGLILVLAIYLMFFKYVIRLYFNVKDNQNKKLTLGIFASGIAFWIISFFSSQLVGRNSSTYFVVLYLLILLIEKSSKINSTSSTAVNIKN